MKTLLPLSLLALTACGVDGPPERPATPVYGLSGPTVLSTEPVGPLYGNSPTYTDENGVMRTQAKSTSVSSGDATPVPADL
ncbi:hypothetical protein MLD63_12730 [Paracoccus sp. TK19116]|uniref:Lipoprotein n=1 Tax=Paracoccus albicereus TaxID=2922394 RepID=A0ABT1MSL6_9RHOB|nr:hypothetical protein [Paracoccus albicereus]MCQ0971288.1 hypothetical protein [Paracoccus albicereus]